VVAAVVTRPAPGPSTLAYPQPPSPFCRDSNHFSASCHVAFGTSTLARDAAKRARTEYWALELSPDFFTVPRTGGGSLNSFPGGGPSFGSIVWVMPGTGFF